MPARTLIAAALLALAAPLLVAQAGRAAYDEGRRLMAQDEPAKAEKAFERAIALEPNVSAYHLWLGNAVGEQAQEANILRQPFMARRVKAEFEKAVELDPRSIEARNGLLGYFLAAPAVMGGGIDKAREQAREIARLDVVQGHMASAQIAWHGKDTVTTEREWRGAIAAAPDSVMPVINLSLRLQGWGRPADAFALFEAFLTRQPRNVPARFQYARLAAISGTQLPQAERHLRDLLADESWVSSGWFPPRAAIHARLGDVLRKQGRTAEARAAYDTALSLDKDSEIAKLGLRALK
jgi:tetratricopeptide (TPR) repeat protein